MVEEAKSTTFMPEKKLTDTLGQIEPVIKNMDQREIEALSQALLHLKKAPIRPLITAVLQEIDNVLKKIDEDEVVRLADDILHAKTIVVCGAGRVGMAIRGFGMRLGHIGLHAFSIGDTTLPSIREGDLLLAASRSGETQTIYDLVEIAKKNGAKVAVVTGSSSSRMAKLADTMVRLKAPSRVNMVEGFASIQPMTTLNEQCMSLFFDAVVLVLMHRLGETHETMWARHSNLE